MSGGNINTTLPMISTSPDFTFSGGAGDGGSAVGAAPSPGVVYQMMKRHYYSLANTPVGQASTAPTGRATNSENISSMLSSGSSNDVSKSITKVEFRKDGNNVIYNLSTSKTPVDYRSIASLYGINIGDPRYHQYTVDTNICFVSDPNCTPAQVFRELSRNPAPFASYSSGVNNGDISSVPGLGKVSHQIDAENFTLTNVTLNDHQLYPGIVYQKLYQDGNIIGIKTIGLGTGNYGALNSALAAFTWTRQGMIISKELYTEAASPFFPPTEWDSLTITPTPSPANASTQGTFPADFDAYEYLASNVGLAQALGTTDPAVASSHYANYGKSEGRPTRSFDGLNYIASYGDLINAYGMDRSNAALHYILYGNQEGRSIKFDGLRYIASYPDLIRAYGADASKATEHYIKFGYNEGRRISFDPQAYENRNPDVLSAYGNKLMEATYHYIIFGFMEGRDNGSGHPLASPVVLDLDGNGIDLILLHQSTAYFDYLKSDEPLRTAWASPHDGILVIETRPQHYEIDFSAMAMADKPFSLAAAPSDMEAVKLLYDTNANGFLDAGDNDWGSFRIWIDKDQNGIVGIGEISSLSDSKIDSINLVPSGETQTFSDGTSIIGTSFFVRSDGTTGAAADVKFAYGSNNSSIESSPGVELAKPITDSKDNDQTFNPPVTNFNDSQLPQKLNFLKSTVGIYHDMQLHRVDDSATQKVEIKEVIGSNFDDTFIFGKGSVASGQLGSDTFDFTHAEGKSVILDFAVGVDKAILKAHDFVDFHHMMTAVSQVGDDLNIYIEDKTTIILEHVKIENLSSRDFLFEQENN